MLAKYAERFGRNWDEHLQELLFAYRTKPHESNHESPFFLLYGRDAKLPCDSTLSAKRTAYQVDIDDYKSELVWSLTDAWEVAKKEVEKAQTKQKSQYDRRTNQREF